MTWSKDTWEKIQPIYQSILKMPFIQELTDGTLEPNKFQFYIAQDSKYLEHFGRALAIIGSRADKIEDSLAFISFAENAITAEKALHEYYFTEYKVTRKEDAQPSCHHYIHFLKSTTALDAIEIGMASVLPCFWIYKAVGEYILKNQTLKYNPYQKWINTYGGEEFADAVTQAINICDKVADASTEKTKKDMSKAFVTATKLEYDFWDSAYKIKRWELDILEN